LDFEGNPINKRRFCFVEKAVQIILDEVGVIKIPFP
jgi:hypothetical protein